MKLKYLGLALCLILLLTGSNGVTYILAHGQGQNDGIIAGYRTGRQQGYSSGFFDGRQQGYSSGESDGYTSGLSAGEANPSTWYNQNCFNYPFALLDSTYYVACHKLQ